MLAFLVWPREREPEYKGIPLSKWLENYKWDDAEFARAIKHMGTNALPFLIRAAKYEEPRWRTWVAHTTLKWWPSADDSRFGRGLLGNKPLSRRGTSVIAFGILGADADPALNELRRIQRDSKDPSTSDCAGQCIQFITERIGSGVDH
jgi:hypothetical protein